MNIESEYFGTTVEFEDNEPLESNRKSTRGCEYLTAFESVRKFHSRSSPLRGRICESTMGNGNSTGQGSYTTYGKRDVGETAERPN